MRSLLLIASGFFLCLLLGVGVDAYSKLTHPFGAVTNHDFPLVQIHGDQKGAEYELRKGDSKLLPYGEYTLTIPDAKASFVLFKNNRGTCGLRSAGGILVVEINENASVQSAK